jgi:hypothetical protein
MILVNNNNDFEAKYEVNELLVGSIRAKLAILESDI